VAKTWKEKLEGTPAPSVQVTDKAMFGIPAGVKMLISSPMEIRDVISSIPKGSSMTVAELREHLAKKHRAKVTCPLTTGIFLRIVSEAALDEMDEGKAVTKITPFWRVVGPKDKVAKKIRCGPDFIAELRTTERI